MKICVNGILRDMTAEEIEAYNRLESAMPPAAPTPEELIAKQAQEIADLKEALDLLLSGVTEVSTDG